MKKEDAMACAPQVHAGVSAHMTVRRATATGAAAGQRRDVGVVAMILRPLMRKFYQLTTGTVVTLCPDNGPTDSDNPYFECHTQNITHNQ